MDSHPCETPRSNGGAPRRPVLVLRGGLAHFLAPRAVSAGGYSTSMEPRIVRAREVFRSEILFQNGLGRDTRACQLIWKHGHEPGEAILAAGDLILSN